jgi:DNA excision repair protein ERCC-4
LTYDAVSFNQLLETVLITNTPAPGSTRQNHSPWLFLDAAHTVFSVAKERVYLKGRINSEESIAPAQVPSGINVILEELPKWGTLKEVLDEIEREIHFNPQNGILLINLPDVDDGTNAVVVMCTDERTCKQLREYLQSSGTDVVMRRKLQEYFSWKSNFQMTRSQLFETKPENGKEDGIS